MRLLWVLAAASVRAAAPCGGPEDCSMLGGCVGGACVCDAGFAGAGCWQLDFGAARTARTVPYANSTWGGHPVRVGGRWHMYVSDVGPCGLHRFKSFSRIIHVVADSVEGPYEFEDVAIPGVAHNAYVHVTPAGELLLWFIGIPYDPGSLSCDVGVAPEAPPNMTSIINVAHSESGSPSGPWTIYTDVLRGMCPPDRTWCRADQVQISNPAPLVLPNGTTIVAFHGENHLRPSKGNFPFTGPEAPGIAVAPSWRGPYALLNPDPIFAAPAPHLDPATGALLPPAEFHGEDFFLWRGRRAYHMVWHVKEPFATAPNGTHGFASTGGMAWSADGRAWHPQPGLAYDGRVVWDAAPNPGPVTARQRPQLVFADAGDVYRPTHGFFGVQTCAFGTKGPEDRSWNVVVPLR